MDDDDLVIAAITVAELRTGIELSSHGRRVEREALLAHVLSSVPVEPYDVATAQAHGRLLAHTRRSGTQRGAYNLLIAATAVVSGRVLITTDRSARFAELPGVDCLVV